MQFGTIKNQLLVAGDDHVIKFWDMDSNELLRAVDADGDLPVSSLCGHLLFREKCCD